MSTLEIKEELKFEAAWMVFDKPSVPSVKKYIDALAKHGIWFDEFLDLTLSKSDSQADLLPVIHAIFQKLDLTISSEDEALKIILKKQLLPIAQKKVDPIEGMGVIMNQIYYIANIPGRSEKVIGDTLGIEHLVGLYWTYLDLDELDPDAIYNGTTVRSLIIEIKNDIVSHANAWLQKHSL